MKNRFLTTDKIDNQIRDGGDPEIEWTVEDSHGNELIDNETVKFYFTFRYGDLYCNDMYPKFYTYNEVHADDLKRALDAWNATYNPLDNYNGKEVRVNIDNVGTETTIRENDPLHNTVTSTAVDGTYTETKTTTDTSDSYRGQTKDEQHGGTVTTDDVKTTNTKSRENTTLSIDGDSYTAHDVRGEIYTRAGNLGVTTSQQMITSECEMRLNPVIKNYLDRFIYMYASYVGGAWD